MPNRAAPSGAWIDTVDPSSTDDSAQTSPRTVGDNWVNTSSQATFTCVDDSPGAAVWVEEDGSGGGGGGSGTPASTVVAERVLDHAASAVGTSTDYARADHTHGTPAMPTASDAGAAPTTRTISTTAPLTGGGDLSADRTIAVDDASTSGKGVVELAHHLGGTATAPTVIGLEETSGPASLLYGAIATDLDVLSRVSGAVIGVSRATIVGATRFIQIIDSQVGADGYTTVQLPTDCEWISFDVQAPGGSGFPGASGNTTAARKGGDPGCSGARTIAVFRRKQLPAQVFVRPGVAALTPNPLQCSIVEVVKSGYTGSVLSTAGAASMLVFAVAANSTTTPVAATPQLALGLKFAQWLAYPGSGGTLASSTGTQVADQTAFGSTTSNGASGGCAGGGLLITTGTPAAGGGWAAMGPFSARPGGAATGAPGTDGVYGGGDSGGWTSTASTVEQLAWGYGGTGGGAKTTGTGGKGGDGAPGCGGGGGGAGGTTGGAGGTGGTGFIVVRGW